MRTLIRSASAFSMLCEAYNENRLSHAYLIVFDDRRNLRAALNEFSKIFFGCFKGFNNRHKNTNIQLENNFNKYMVGDFLSNIDKNTISSYNRISDLIEKESFSDCIFLPEEGKKFSVEDAEKVLEESTLKPVEGDKKLFVIGNLADATPQAQNKLLKLLEEPPKGVYFLLGTTVTFSVLTTVLSRTSVLEIPSFPLKEQTEALKRLYPKERETELTVYAAASGGSLGVAQNMIEGGFYGKLINGAFTLAGGKSSSVPAVAKEFGDTKYKKEFLSVLRLLFRDAAIVKTYSEKYGRKKDSPLLGGSGKVADMLVLKTEIPRVEIIAENYTLPALVYAQEVISDAEKDVKFNAVFSQTLEICIGRIAAKNKRQNV